MPHWRENLDNTYLGVWDFGDNKNIILTIEKVGCGEELTGANNRKSRKNILYFTEKYNPMVLNKTNNKTLEALFGSDTDKWKGHKIKIYFDPSIRFGKEMVGGLRIKNEEIASENTSRKIIKCDCCGKEIKPMGGRSSEQLAQYTKEKYGTLLCAECATQAAKDVNSNGSTT